MNRKNLLDLKTEDLTSERILNSKQLVYIVYLNDKPYKTTNGVTVHYEYNKAENYMNNAIRNVGRLLCKNAPWYNMEEENKQKWFDEAKKMLSVKSFIETF